MIMGVALFNLIVCVTSLPHRARADENQSGVVPTYYSLTPLRKLRLAASVFVDGDTAKRADVAYFYSATSIEKDMSSAAREKLSTLLGAGYAYVAVPDFSADSLVIKPIDDSKRDALTATYKKLFGENVGFILPDRLDEKTPYKTVVSWYGGFSAQPPHKEPFR